MDMSKTMKAVITVVGKDTVGIIAKVSNVCMEYKVNIGNNRFQHTDI